MKTKKIIIWSIGVLLLVGIAFLISPSKSGKMENSNSITYSNSSITVAENNFDFGTILMGDGIVSNKFEVVNNGSEPVKIGKVYTSCACTTAYIIDSAGKKYGKFGMPGHDGLRAAANVEVQPGETIMVEAIYDPAFHGPSGVGLAERVIYLETNSINSPKVKLSFRATVTR